MNEKINKNSMFHIGYGLYVVTCNDGVKDNGLVVNTVIQVTSEPNRVAVVINKVNYSHEVIQMNKKMNVNILSTDSPFEVFKHFGYQSGRNVNKFEGTKVNRSENGLAIIPEFINSYLSLEVINSIDLGTHTMFICDVSEAKVVQEKETMTYSYYQANVKPKPIKAKKGYVCKICGYVHEGDELPEDYICPICKHGVSDFEKINNNLQDNGGNNMKYRCKVCGQIVDIKEGESCPICGAKFEKLEPVVEAPAGKLEWACKHEVGVAQGVDPFVLEGCRDHFKGECSEVGMYLAMARVALREGYPEIAMLLEQIAHEEAEHAAKFAELLGEVITDSTKANIEKMLAGENGACASKLAIAKKAKELNYDAIHDAVHEMARDEQRHGAALEAMLKRYFK